MEYLHEHIPPFVDSAYSEARDIAVESNYTVESAPSENDSYVDGLLFPIPSALESSAPKASDVSPRILSGQIYPVAPDLDPLAVRPDEDQGEHETKVGDSASGPCEGDTGENCALFSGSPAHSHRPEAEAQQQAEGMDAKKGLGSPAQSPASHHDKELPATAPLGTPVEPSMGLVTAAQPTATGVPRPNDFTSSILHDEVSVEGQSLQLSTGACEGPIRRAQSAPPVPSGDVKLQSDPEGELAPCTGASNGVHQDGRDQIILSISLNGDGPNDVAPGDPQNAAAAALHQESVPLDLHPTSDPDGPTLEDMSAPSVVPTLGFDSTSSRTDSSIAPSSPRSELSISAQFSDVGDDTRSEVSAASQVPAAPSSPRPATNEDFFTPALRTLWKLETPVTPTGTSKAQPSPSTPALTVGRTDHGLDSNLVTPVVSQPERLHQEQLGLCATNPGNMTSPLWDSTIGIVRVADTSADTLPQIVTAKIPSALQTPKYELARNVSTGLDASFAASLERSGRTDAKRVDPRGANNVEEIADSGNNVKIPKMPKAHLVDVVNDRLSAVPAETPGSPASPRPQRSGVAAANSLRATGCTSLASDTTEPISITPSNLSLYEDGPVHTIVVEQNDRATESQISTVAFGTAIAPIRTCTNTIPVADHPSVGGEPPNSYQVPPRVEDAARPDPAGESIRPIDINDPSNDFTNAKTAQSPNLGSSPVQVKASTLCYGSDLAEPVFSIYPDLVESGAVGPLDSVANTFDSPFPQKTLDRSLTVEPHVVAPSTSISDSFGPFESLDLPDLCSGAAESHIPIFPKIVLAPDEESSSQNMSGNCLDPVKPQTWMTSEPVSNPPDQLFPQAPPVNHPDSVEVIPEFPAQPTHTNIVNETPEPVEPEVDTASSPVPHSSNQLISQAAQVDAPDLAPPQTTTSPKPNLEPVDRFTTQGIRNNKPEVVEPQAVASPELVSNTFAPPVTRHSSANNPGGAESQDAASSSTISSSFEEPIPPNVQRNILEDIEPQAAASELAVSCSGQPIFQNNPPNDPEVVESQVIASSQSDANLFTHLNHHDVPVGGPEVVERAALSGESVESVSTPSGPLIPPHVAIDGPQADGPQDVYSEGTNLNCFHHPVPQDTASHRHSTAPSRHVTDASEELPPTRRPLKRSSTPNAAHAADAILVTTATDASLVEVDTEDTVCGLLYY